MHPRNLRLGATLLASLVVVAACSDNGPTSAPSNGAATPPPGATPTAPPPTILPSPTSPIPASFPLAVVTGLTNNKTVITMDDLSAVDEAATWLVPCGIVPVELPNASQQCVPGEQIVGMIEAKPTSIAVVPVGMVEPATKVLAF